MRTSFLAVVVFGVLSFAAGCSQPTSPTAAPSIAPSVSSPSLVLHVAAQGQVLLKGTLQGNDVDSNFTGTTVVVTTTGTGNGTLLGKFSFTQEVTVNFANGTSAGSAHFVAANGDSIDTIVAGSGHPGATPDVLNITDVHTITGGTGRFAGAQGTFTVDREASTVTFLTSGSFDGTMTSPDAAH